MINNKIEKSFGPTGSFAGILVFIMGLYASYYTIFGLLLICIGAFVGFTSISTLIDLDKKRVKLSTNLFGLFKKGNWIPIESGMKVKLNVSHQVWAAYSQSNRAIETEEENLQIILTNAKNEMIIPLKKLASPHNAMEEVEELKNQLEL